MCHHFNGSSITEHYHFLFMNKKLRLSELIVHNNIPILDE